MKKLLLLVLCLAWASLSQAATYFVSNQGHDANSGKSPDLAWRTLGKVNAMMASFKPGDVILFKRGHRFAGKIVVTASGEEGRPITFGAYGSGDRPIINGFQRLSQWESVGNNIWKTSYQSPYGQAYNLLINHVSQPIGRYPNADEGEGGYLPIDGGNGWSQFNSPALRGGPWKGADAVVRSRRWILDRVPIIQHQGTQISLGHRVNYNTENGYGFIIVNHRNTLDQEGEWAYHAGEHALYLHTKRDPNTQAILTAHEPELFKMDRVQHITIQQLELWGSAQDAVHINYSQHITVRKCRFYSSGQNGATVKYSERVSFLDNHFENTNNNGIEVEQGKYTEIASNIFLHTGLNPGMGNSGDNAYCAVRGKTQHFNVHHNRIDQVGYNGVTFVGDYINIQYNHITNFCLIKDDGAGIYAGNSAPYPHNLLQIKNNIVGDGFRRSVGWGTNRSDLVHVNGIYLDNHSNAAVIENNTVYRCENYGIYLHNAYNNRLKNNTFYDNWRALGMSHDVRAIDAPLRDNIVQNNVFFARKASQELLHLRSIKDDHFQFGTINQNYYYSPLKHERVIRSTDKNYQNQLYSVAQWQKHSPYDQLSHAGTERWPTYVINRYLSGNLLPNATFTDNIRGWQGWSSDGDGMIQHADAIDGGSLAMAFASQGDGSLLSVSPNTGIGSLTKNEKLVLHYSLMSDGKGATLDTKIVQKGGGYVLLSNINYVSASTQRQDIEEFFTINQSTAEGALTIRLPKNENLVFLDNVSLRKVATQAVNYDQYVQFLANPSRQRTSMSLPSGQWKSARGQTYRGSVTLEPFQSMILLRSEQELASLQAARQAHREQDVSVIPSEKRSQPEDLLAPESDAERLKVYPNPLRSGRLTVDLGTATESAEVQVYNAAGRLVASRSVAGQQKVTFTKRSLGSGFYLIKMITPTRTITEKVVIE